MKDPELDAAGSSPHRKMMLAVATACWVLLGGCVGLVVSVPVAFLVALIFGPGMQHAPGPGLVLGMLCLPVGFLGGCVVSGWWSARKARAMW